MPGERGNIFLAGFMGTGKTEVGRRLARLAGKEFVDLDEKIEELEVMSITEIFAQKGEPYFREVEHRLLREICGRGGQVVALGGGVVCEERNRELLENAGPVILLTAEPGEIWKRVGQDSGRPLLGGEGGYGRMRELLAKREKAYGRYRLAVNTTGRTPGEVAEEILGIAAASETEGR